MIVLRLWMMIGLLCLAGCASKDNSPEAAQSSKQGSDSESSTPSFGSAIGGIFSGTFEGAIAAVVSPFEDIGLKRDKIPDKLQTLTGNPYAMPASLRCSALREEINGLNDLLGPEQALAKDDNEMTNQEYVDKGASMATKQAVGMIRGHTTGFIPYRGVVRAISGAEKHSREVSNAYEAGKLRRAFLTGLMGAQGKGCLKAPAKAVAKKVKTDSTQVAAR